MCRTFRRKVDIMGSLLKTICHNLARRSVALAVLLAILMSVVPIPTGSGRSNSKDRSASFPCQNRPCGCRTAEQCWKRCCCFTNSQKLAWASANSVHAPAFVVAAAKQERHVTFEKKKSCCHLSGDANAIVKNCQTDGLEPAKRECCQKAPDRQSEPVQSFPIPINNFVVGVFAEKCHGHNSIWNSLPWSILPECASTLSTVPLDLDPLLPVSDFAISLTERPPVPPPRFAHNYLNFDLNFAPIPV